MKKNTASQVIGAQMVSATDGSAFTGAVTCYVTGNGGTQAAGSVGSGACVHEGNGFHSYAPAQAETNYDHIAFTFTGTGAIPVTIQVFPSFPQTGDNFARLGAPAGASVSADIAANTTAIAANTTAIGVVDDFLDTEVAAIKAKTDLIPAAPAAVGDIPTATQNADALLKRDMSAVTEGSGRTPLQALRFLRNKWSIAGGTLTVTKEDDSTSSWTAAVAGTAGADPITSVDPA
jgi:hypothetical protein